MGTGELYTTNTIYKESFIYPSYIGLPGSETLPVNWKIISGNWTTNSQWWLESIEPGELLYIGTGFHELTHQELTDPANFAITITFKAIEDLKFEIRTRRSDDSNFISLEIDFENNKLKIKKTEAGTETILDDQNFKWDENRNAYGIELWTYYDRIEGYVNRMPFAAAISDFNQTKDGFSICVPEMWNDQTNKFYNLWIQNVDAYPEPQLEFSDDLMVLKRKELKQTIENPISYDWETFTQARKIWEKGKDYGKNDEEWASLGYPIREPFFELWYQNM